jgi:glycosyltransferase involved in cell wall biosynthesis
MSYRVLHICNKVVPPGRTCGGLNRMVCWLAEEQFRNGYQVFIGSPRGESTQYFEFIDYSGANDFESFSARIPPGIDFIFYHGGFDFIADKLNHLGIPFISVHHGVSSGPIKLQNPVFVSRSHARQHGGERFVYNGIPAPEENYSGDKDPYLLFLGKVSRSKKGAKEAVQAAIKSKHRIVVAGGRKLDIPHTWFNWHPLVSPVGYVDGQAKFDLIKRAKALLVPIKWEEPFGLTIVEALACGTPVIAYNRGAAPELVRNGENGYLCNSLKELIAAIYVVETISSLACRRSYLENFTVQEMFKNYHRLVEEIKSNWPMSW